MHVTLSLFDQFLAAKRLAGLSRRTICTYDQRVGHFVRWLGQRPLDRPTIRTYISHLNETRTLATVAAYVRDVSAFCGWLVAEEYMPRNPTSKLRPKLPKRKPASYSRLQVRRLIEVAGPRDRAIMITMLDTGLRAGELCSMRRTTIDPDTGHFTVIGKGDKERSSWLSAFAVGAIGAYLTTRSDSNPALWLSRDGGPLTPAGVHQMLHRRATAAGIRADVQRLLHSFRATFARNYITQGGDLESLRRLLGHESIAMSAHYAQLANDELAAKKRRINPLAAMLGEVPE